MTGRIHTGRRRVLRAGGACLAFSLFGGVSATPLSVAGRVRNSFVDPAAAELLGAAWLDSRPRSTSVAALVAELVEADRRWTPLLHAGTTPAIRRFAAQQCLEDFERNDLVSIDGWLLAVTEVRLCGLAALGPADSGT